MKSIVMVALVAILAVVALTGCDNADPKPADVPLVESNPNPANSVLVESNEALVIVAEEEWKARNRSVTKRQKPRASTARPDPEVMADQIDLQNQGCDPGPIDGLLGPATRDAIRRLARGECGLSTSPRQQQARVSEPDGEEHFARCLVQLRERAESSPIDMGGGIMVARRRDSNRTDVCAPTGIPEPEVRVAVERFNLNHGHNSNFRLAESRVKRSETERVPYPDESEPPRKRRRLRR